MENTPQKIKLIITDDSKEFREGLKFFFSRRPQYEIIGEAADGAELLQLDNVHMADIILIDIVMPQINGFEAAKLLQRRHHWIKMIAITMFKDKAYLLDLISSGFKGCIYKMDIFAELEKSINIVLNNNLAFPEEIKLEFFNSK